MEFQTVDQIKEYVAQMSRSQLLEEASKYAEVTQFMKDDYLQAIIVDHWVAQWKLGDAPNFLNRTGDDDKINVHVEKEKLAVNNQKRRQPRKLSIADRTTPRGYKRLIKFFQALELVGNLEGQMEFVKQAHHYWQERQIRKRGRKKTKLSNYSIDELREFLRKNPDVLAAIKSDLDA